MEKVAHFFSFKAPGKIRITPEIIAIISILMLGLFLRIYKIKDYIVFLGDEGRDALVVYQILHGDLTLLGPTSSVGGFFLGPIYYYFMAPFLWLWGYDPAGPAVMVVLFGIATIYLVYRLGKEFFGTKAGLISSLLYAVSPIVIIYSRSSWNPNVFPFFTLSSLYSLYLAVTGKKWWLFVLSGFLMGINLQIHYLATFVGVIMFVYVLLADFKPKLEWVKETLKRYGLMFAGFLIGFSPFLAFEARHEFANSQNIIRFIFNSNDTGVAGNVSMNVGIVFNRLFGELVLSFPASLNFTKYDPGLIAVWQLTGIILGLTSIFFFVYYFFKSYKNKTAYRKYLLLFTWMLIGIGLFLFYKKSVYDYYLGFLFPIPFLLIGFLLSSIADKFKKIGLAIVILAIVVLVSVNLKFTPIATPGNQQAKQMKMISDFIISKTNGEPYNFANSGIGNSDHAYRYFFKLAGRDPVVIYGINIDPQRVTVTDQLFVVCEKKPCSPLGESSNEIAGFGRAEIDKEWDVSVVRIYKLKHYEGEE